MNDIPATKISAQRIAVLLPSLEGGGAERSMLNLIKGFLARGRTVDLLLCQAKGALMGELPEGVTLIELEPVSGLQTRWLIAAGKLRDFFVLLRPILLTKKTEPELARIPALQQYLKSAQPDVVLSAITYANVALIWAKQMSGSSVPVVVSERIALSTYCSAPSNFRKWRWRYLPAVVHRTYPGADAVIAVSHHAADELVNDIGLSRQSVKTIYNPVVDDTLRVRAEAALDHPWFLPDAVPVILAVGRLTEQKDFPTLIRAFAQVRRDTPARLVILGEGRLHQTLAQLAAELGVQDDVDMPGFVDNPFQYMSRAKLFVLSSLYEGLPGVLIQALACGCPVVSTDCPGGSREILADGEYGALVPVGQVEPMADALRAGMATHADRDKLQRRAQDFSVDRAVNNYLDLLDSTVARAAT
jgi:glycosyltransferase involved in cell wall biosynthesis